MPKNPTDYTVEQMPDWLLSASARLQVLRSKMDIVNLSRRASYDDSDMDQLDASIDLLNKMSHRFAELNAAVAEETRQFDQERRAARAVSSPPPAGRAA